MLLTYFNEHKTKNCGICDVCLQKNKLGLSNFEFGKIRALLLDCFSDTPNYRLNELVDKTKSSIPESDKVIAVLRHMIDKDVFELEDDTIRLQQKK